MVVCWEIRENARTIWGVLSPGGMMVLWRVPRKVMKERGVVWRDLRGRVEGMMHWMMGWVLLVRGLPTAAAAAVATAVLTWSNVCCGIQVITDIGRL